MIDFFVCLLQGNTYPELEENPQYIADVLNKEEEQFLITLRKGEKYLKKALTELTSHKVLPGKKNHPPKLSFLVELCREHLKRINNNNINS